jgi:hypothetical protein
MVLIGYTWENDAYSWQDHVEASLAQPAMSGPQNWQEEGTPPNFIPPNWQALCAEEPDAVSGHCQGATAIRGQATGVKGSK